MTQSIPLAKNEVPVEASLGKGITVLVVEDDQMISELVVTKLTQSGFTAYATVDGSETLALAEKHKPDVIILDLMLTGMAGEEVLKGLKGNDALKSIPVVVFSNKSEETDKMKVMDLGAEQYLVKAMTNLNELVEELKKIVQKRRVG